MSLLDEDGTRTHWDERLLVAICVGSLQYYVTNPGILFSSLSSVLFYSVLSVLK